MNLKKKRVGCKTKCLVMRMRMEFAVDFPRAVVLYSVCIVS